MLREFVRVKTVDGVKVNVIVHALEVTGLVAAAIERAGRASFYGVHGSAPDCIAARRQVNDVIYNYIAENNIPWLSFLIRSARSINADGTSIEYRVQDINNSLILKTITLDGTRTFRGLFRYENFGWKFVA